MKLRWQQALATNNKDDDQADENKEEEDITEFYDNHKKTFDLTTVPATNVPFNKRATMPPYADEDTEAKIAFARKRLHSSIEDQCRKSKGAENLSDNAKKGLKQIKKRLKDKEVVCFPTDKSGRMSIDNPRNYSKSMLKHFYGMPKTNLENYYEVERVLNAHMRSWFIIMKGNQRLARNFRASNNTMPPSTD